MTRLIPLNQLVTVGDEYAVFITKDEFKLGDKIVAQEEDEEQEYSIQSILNAWHFIKKEHTMYILKRKD